MSDSRPSSVDFTSIADPDVRRALRAMYQEMKETLNRQQVEIDALLEMMIDKNHASLSDFKRHMVRLLQNTSRGDRIHDAIAAAAQTIAAQAPAPGAKATHY